MTNAVEEALSRLPDDVVTRDQDIVAKYTTDFRRFYTGTTQAVLRPRNNEEVQTIVRTCADLRVPLVPQGGNTSYCTAATPDRGGGELVISLERMNRVRDLDPANLSITAEAGMVLSDLQDAAEAVGLMLPLSLGSQQSCRIGGNLSTNAGGVSVVRYGMAREQVLGLEVVLPDGSLYSELSPLRKNNSGYDVKQLFIGAEGTLGIITAVSLKLVRQPRHVVTAFLAIRDIGSLSELLNAAQIQTGESVTSFEYLSNASLRLLFEARPDFRLPLTDTSEHYVLMEASTASPMFDLDEALTALLGELLEQGTVLDGAIAASRQQAAEFWRLRESIPEAEVHFGGSVKHDVAVRCSRLAAFIESAVDIVVRHDSRIRLSGYGHVGDGNVHFNVVAPPGANPQAFKSAFERDVSPLIYDLAAAMEGTFSAEYGIGRTKLELAAKYGAPRKNDLMRAIRQALDPDGLMNPGKVVLR